MAILPLSEVVLYTDCIILSISGASEVYVGLHGF